MAHIGIVVRDIEKSKEFYVKVLGCEVEGSHEDDRLKFLYLNSGGQTIELLEYKSVYEDRGKGIIDHLAFNVDNLQEAIDRAESFGAVMLFDVPKDANGKKIMFFHGPDGERIEFME